MTLVFPLFLALLCSALTIPSIIKVASLKHLMDEPSEDRKVHTHRTPTLGGIAIFSGTIFSFAFFTDYLDLREVHFMTPSLILLFLAGLKDDISLLTPLKKLTIQIICALLITVFGKLYLTSLWGMFEFNEIPSFVGIMITFLVIVALINAYNLIDGVNGLAGGLGLIACVFFGSWFYITGAYSLSILAFSLAGSLIGFLIFNFGRAKIFMGDTGSMILGFIIAILSIKFIELNRIPGFENSEYYIKAAPGVAVAVVMIPLFDMSRVFFQRLINKQSPFKADRRHIHHILLDMGLKHTTVSLILYSFAVLFCAIGMYLKELRSLQLAMILAVFAAAFTLIAVIIRKSLQSKKVLSESRTA